VNIGEFFLSLGIKGAEKTLSALSNAKKGMGELGSASLEAKAALLGAAYAFERLMSNSARAGTDLENFNALTGISAQTLQQYQYAARQVGISNEEMASTFKGVQNVMTNMRLGKGAPEGLAILSGKVGFDSNRAKSDTTYVMKKLQEFANAEHEVGMRNFVLKSFGVGENVMAGMARNAFRPEVMQKAPTYNEKEIHHLDQANAAWSNLGNQVQMAIGHFNAAHGTQLVKDLSMILDKVIKLTEAFLKLAEVLHLFEGIGKIFEGWGKIFDLANGGVKKVKDALSSPEGTKELGKNTLGFLKEMPSVLGVMAGDLAEKIMPSAQAAGPNAAALKVKPSANPITPKMVSPSVGNSVQSNSTQNNVNQTFHFQTDGSNHKQVGDANQKAVTKAFYQIQQGGI